MHTSRLDIKKVQLFNKEVIRIMTFRCENFHAITRNSRSIVFRDLSDDELLDAIDYYESVDLKNSTIGNLDKFTYINLIEYGEYRGLITIVKEDSLNDI